jgi:polyhydroxybutyrate depolymerase
MMKKITLLVLAIFFTVSCGDAHLEEEPVPFEPFEEQNDHDPNEEQGEQEEEPMARPYMGPIGGDRPVTANFPDDYDVEGNYPLLIQLHGYGSNALQTEAFFLTYQLANELGVVTLTPEGTINADGNRYWNLFLDTGVDDLGYISALIDEAVERYAVDPDRVFLLGLSNGGFMSHLMACERGDLVRGIISFNGSSYLNASDCRADRPVQIIHVHATLDLVVPYYGNAYIPGARVVAERWAGFNGCDGEPVQGPNVDVTHTIDGDETTTEIWENCDDDLDVQLWSIHGAGHVPLPLSDFARLMFDAIL